jgi:Zn-finger nucleic acid-binding protein
MALKSSTSGEREFIVREEVLKKQKLALEQAKKELAQKKEQLRQLHWMRCPKDGAELHAIDFHGVEIDRCPECNGVWLDGGDLERLAVHEKTHPQRGAVVRSILNIFKEPEKTRKARK